MNNNEYLNKIEELNFQYLNSREYKIGTYVCFILDLLKKKKYINLIKLLLIKNKNKNKHNEETNEIIVSKPFGINSSSKDKIAIYTCITGNYDRIINPIFYEKNCDYIIFTNNKKIKSNFWKIIYIDEIHNISDNILLNRYIKMHPKEFLKEYDYSIYIDGNIQIVSTISEYKDKINSETGLALHQHHDSKSLSDEIKSCRKYSKGNYKNLKKQVNGYINEGMNDNFGLYECNLIVSDLKNGNAAYLLNEWWKEFFKTKSFRDQLSFPYIIWKNGYKFNSIGIIGENININSHIRIISHK